MGRIISSVVASLDGFNAGPDGGFDWAEPDDEVVDAINDDLAGVSTFLYGRRMYEMLTVWETDPAAAAISPASADFARIWQAADKVVFSRTLERATTAHTRIERALTREAVVRERDAAAGDCTIEGPIVARQVLAMGLVDVVELYLCPVVVGGGNAVFPEGLRVDFRHTATRTFGNGMVRVRYEAAR